MYADDVSLSLNVDAEVQAAQVCCVFLITLGYVSVISVLL